MCHNPLNKYRIWTPGQVLGFAYGFFFFLILVAILPFCLSFLICEFYNFGELLPLKFSDLYLFSLYQVYWKSLLWNLARNDKELGVNSTEHPPRMMTPKLKAFFNHHSGVNDVDISSPTSSHWWICSEGREHPGVTAAMARGRAVRKGWMHSCAYVFWRPRLLADGSKMGCKKNEFYHWKRVQTQQRQTLGRENSQYRPISSSSHHGTGLFHYTSQGKMFLYRSVLQETASIKAIC